MFQAASLLSAAQQCQGADVCHVRGLPDPKLEEQRFGMAMFQAVAMALRNRSLDELLAEARTQSFTYPEVGATRDGALPAGYSHLRRSLPLGEGEVAWARAQEALRLWQAHHNCGFAITPPDLPIEDGATVLATLAAGPFLVVEPTRIAYTTITPRRFGFGLGTLPGHSVRGEIALHVEISQNGAVTGELAWFSRPNTTFMKVLGPLGKVAENSNAPRYLAGISKYVHSDQG